MTRTRDMLVAVIVIALAVALFLWRFDACGITGPDIEVAALEQRRAARRADEPRLGAATRRDSATADSLRQARRAAAVRTTSADSSRRVVRELIELRGDTAVVGGADSAAAVLPPEVTELIHRDDEAIAAARAELALARAAAVADSVEKADLRAEVANLRAERAAAEGEIAALRAPRPRRWGGRLGAIAGGVAVVAAAIVIRGAL